jgi:SAM-dependent methyltransferase
MVSLNLGCGRDIKPGWINIDAQPGPGVDLVLDLEDGILPFADESVQGVYCSHVLEHIWDWEKLVLEVHRVLKVGGCFRVRVPKGMVPCAYHVRSFEPWTLDWFIEGTGEGDDMSLEPRARFKLVWRKLGRKFPFYWHIRHYLHIPVPFECRLGRAWEIDWLLVKVRGD